MAGIPVVGPEMGAEAAAQTYAAIMAFAGMVPAAAGGWDVPADSLAYLHKQEMVLPASLAEGVRGLVAGGGKDAGGGDTHVHFNFGGSMDRSWFLKTTGPTSWRPSSPECGTAGALNDVPVGGPPWPPKLTYMLPVPSYQFPVPSAFSDNWQLVTWELRKALL